MAFTLEEVMKPQISKVARSTKGLVISIAGPNGCGKTVVATQMEKPYYLAFGKSGLSGLNGVPFQSIKSWSEFKSFVKVFCDPKNFDEIYKEFNCLIIDEIEILWRYCETYTCNTNQVNKLREGQYGQLYKDLTEEWEDVMMQVIGSGFCIMFILHETYDENGKAFPAGDKRMLPILRNHSDIIGRVIPNGTDADNKVILSSLGLADTNEYFARTRNPYFDTIIPTYTAENLIKAYYTALDRQEKAEGIKSVSKEERDAQYEKKKMPFKELMELVQATGEKVADKYGSIEPITEIADRVLGKGAMVSKCTARQYEAVEIILGELQALLEQD